ncbi:hypothetical protein [uncultured Sulfitobacter sp.]|uniref:hypothetical protein n=1 Tax=uncultured Sulfitobacter sp. TaxID=191468 RepID=UPI0026323F09|nr:hypothetical protein [uncultured Sulfitobacter sp.]
MAGVFGGYWVRQELLNAALMEAISNLRSQKEDLRNVRSHSAFSATVSSIIASVFASMIAGQDLEPLFSGHTFLGVNFIFLGAVCLFVLSLFFSMQVLTKVQDVTFEANPTALLHWSKWDDHANSGLTQLVEDLVGDFEKNEEVIHGVMGNLQLALIFGAAQIIPWTMVVANMV